MRYLSRSLYIDYHSIKISLTVYPANLNIFKKLLFLLEIFFFNQKPTFTTFKVTTI